MIARLALWIFAAFFVTAGIYHFVRPGPFLKIIPPWMIPSSIALPGSEAFETIKRAMVSVSGVAEILFGTLLFFPGTRSYGAWGIIALLIAVFPANYYMFQRADLFPIPLWVLIVRLPLQGALIYWASRYT